MNDAAVLRGRPLIHVRSLSMQNLNPFIALFLSFFLHENSQKECIRVRKKGWFERQAHTVNDGNVDCKKTNSLGASSLTSPASASLRLFLPYDLFFMRHDGLSILKACLYIFLPNMCLRKSHYLKFRRASPQCVALHTVIHFYFGADLLSVISVQAFFTEFKSLPKF